MGGECEAIVNPALTWVARSTPLGSPASNNNALYANAYSPTRKESVLVGFGQNKPFMYTTDGVAFPRDAIPDETKDFRCVVWMPGRAKYCALSFNGSVALNGLPGAWTSHAAPAGAWQSMDYDNLNDRLVAVGGEVGNLDKLAISADGGDNWTTGNTGFTLTSLHGIRRCSNLGLWVACGSRTALGASDNVLTSSTGLGGAWTGKGLIGSVTVNATRWTQPLWIDDLAKFIMFDSGGVNSSDTVAYSTDLTNYTLATGIGNSIPGSAYFPGYGIISNASNGTFGRSTDGGATWASSSLPQVGLTLGTGQYGANEFYTAFFARVTSNANQIYTLDPFYPC